MKLHQLVMRAVAPSCERHRREYRQRLDEAQAHAEDLTRTCKLNGFSKEHTMPKDYFEGRSIEELNLWSGDAKEERSLLRKVVGVVALVLAAGMLLASLGCASVPECDELQMYVMQSPGGVIYMLDEQGLAKLSERQRALQRGTCRLPGLE